MNGAMSYAKKGFLSAGRKKVTGYGMNMVTHLFLPGIVIDNEIIKLSSLQAGKLESLKAIKRLTESYFSKSLLYSPYPSFPSSSAEIKRRAAELMQ